MQQSYGVVDGWDAACYTHSCKQLSRNPEQCFQKATEEHRTVLKLNIFTYIQSQLLKKDHAVPRALAFQCYLNLNTHKESTLGGGGCVCTHLLVDPGVTESKENKFPSSEG